MSQSIAANPDRLLPADPGTRSIARDLLQRVQDLPIISPHGHVDAAVIEHNTPFPDPAALLVSPDHYVTRLIHASGVPLDRLRDSKTTQPDSRAVWHEFCKAWPLFEGTASGYWLRTQFDSVFGLQQEISAETADASYDAISAKLLEPGFRPRQLFKDFNIEVLATTDDPLDSLASHKAIADDPTFHGRVLPTFRPDQYLNIAHPACPPTLTASSRQRATAAPAMPGTSPRWKTGVVISWSTAQFPRTTASARRQRSSSTPAMRQSCLTGPAPARPRRRTAKTSKPT